MSWVKKTKEFGETKFLNEKREKFCEDRRSPQQQKRPQEFPMIMTNLKYVGRKVKGEWFEIRFEIDGMSILGDGVICQRNISAFKNVGSLIQITSIL